MKYFILLFTLFVINNVFSQEINSQTRSYRIDSLMRKADTLYKEAFRERALESIQKAKGLAEDNFGINSKVYGDVCQREGWYLENMGYFKSAKNSYQSAVNIRQNEQPLHQGDLAESLLSLAGISRTLGDYNTAISAMKSLIDLSEQSLHNDTKSLYEQYAELAKLYREIGHFSKADSFYVKASELPEKFEIPIPESMSLLLHDWARMAMEMGHYQKAEEKFERAKNLFDTKNKKKSPEYVMVLAGFASLYTYLGRHDKSKELLLEAKSRSADGWWLFKKLPYGPVLIGLSDLYKQTDELKKAEKLYLAAIDIMESEGQTTVPEYPTALQELGILYHQMGEDGESAYYFTEAVTKWETLSKGRIPGYPKTMMDLASLYLIKGDYPRAKDLLFKAKSFWEENTITDYPIYFYCLFDLSKVYWLTGDFAKADSLYAQAALLGRNRLAEAIQYMSGSELDEYLSRFLKYKAEILHFAITSPISELTAEACYDNTLFYKGFLLNAALQLKNQAQNDTLALPVYHNLIDYRRQIGYEFTKPLEERQELSSLIHYADSLEKELVCMLSGNTILSVPVTWKEIRNQLSEDEVAIEFSHYKVMTPLVTDSIMYVAQLIYHDSDKPIHIPIFEEKDLWVLLDGYTVRKADFVNDFYAHRDRGPVRIGKRIDLYDIIWRPIHSVLRSNVKTIHIAPSGILHYLNFGAIPVTESSNLSDLYKINLLGSTRKLIPDLMMTEKNTAKTGYIFSGIDYNATGFESNNAAQINSDNNQSTPLEINSSRNEQLSGAWAYLYWTAFEGDSISSLLSSSQIPFYHFKNKEAREEEVKKLGEGENASPGIIHFATHGFFYADKNSSADKQNTGSIFKSSENPMFRSGLIMAGANNNWKTELISRTDNEDGILTAYEISQLNLTNTELVVLSACETGLGDIQGNEGVYGLQRAFKIAGAKYLIMSLWQVPDRETMEFMTTFYRNWLEEKLTIPDAFRKTQREMRDRFYNPYSWAGFVLVE